MLARRRPLLLLLAVVAVAALLGSLNDREPGDGASPAGPGRPATPAPATGAPGTGAGAGVRLSPVVSLTQPVALAMRSGDPVLYVAEKTGRVRAVTLGPSGKATGEPALVLDVASKVSSGGEQGLLGLAFSPDGTLMYVNYTDTEGTTRVVEYALAGGRAVPASARELLVVDQPFVNHNGGNLVFGPDGMLWIGLGDGGSRYDPENRAQDGSTLLGKMLRIDPRPSAGRAYSIPPDNPFVATSGTRPEIWALGLRNPWRYSFDRQTGDLWIGDVGQNAVEEIDFEPAGTPGGRNYGWSRFEGTRQVSDRPAPAAVPPAFEFSHGNGDCSVTGGYVYRGARNPDLNGTYLYSDYCGGGVRALRRRADGQVQDLGPLGLDVDSVVSFGQDTDGEIYVLTMDGPVYRLDPA